MDLEKIETMYSEVIVTETVAKDLGLTAAEYQSIVSSECRRLCELGPETDLIHFDRQQSL